MLSNVKEKILRILRKKRVTVIPLEEVPESSISRFFKRVESKLPGDPYLDRLSREFDNGSEGLND